MAAAVSIEVVFGKPLKFCKDEGKVSKSFYEDVSITVMDHIALNWVAFLSDPASI